MGFRQQQTMDVCLSVIVLAARRPPLPRAKVTWTPGGTAEGGRAAGRTVGRAGGRSVRWAGGRVGLRQRGRAAAAASVLTSLQGLSSPVPSRTDRRRQRGVRSDRGAAGSVPDCSVEEPAPSAGARLAHADAGRGAAVGLARRLLRPPRACVSPSPFQATCLCTVRDEDEG